MSLLSKCVSLPIFNIFSNNHIFLAGEIIPNRIVPSKYSESDDWEIISRFRYSFDKPSITNIKYFNFSSFFCVL